MAALEKPKTPYPRPKEQEYIARREAKRRNYVDTKDMEGVEKGFTRIEVNHAVGVMYVYTRDNKLAHRLNNMCDKYPNLYRKMERRLHPVTHTHLNIYSIDADRLAFKRGPSPHDEQRKAKRVKAQEEWLRQNQLTDAQYRALLHEHRIQRIKQAARKRPIRCIETGEEFPSIAAAARVYDVDDTRIARSIKKGQRAGGVHWEFIDED